MREIIVNNYPKSPVAEAIKTVKTNLRFTSANKIKTILVTSSQGGEGKSFISANLAATFADSKEKVLLIDCDLRRGRIHSIFNKKIDNSFGLSNLLIDNKWEKKLNKYIKNTKIENLDILTTGILPPNPTILLENEKLEKVIEKFKNIYDVIILDTPPVRGLTDTLILTRLADAVIVVVKAKKTTFELLADTKNTLEKVNANITGVILNNIDEKINKYYKIYQ